MNIGKLQDIKLTHRNPLHSYTRAMTKQKEKLRKQHCKKKNENLGTNLSKETKNLYIENIKH